jgi:hypothetical protein
MANFEKHKLLIELSQKAKEKIKLIATIVEGIPYKFGAEVELTKIAGELKRSGKPIDCSELVEYVYHRIGLKIPDGSYNQYDVSAPIPESIADIGDLVFKKKNNKINHVGIVVETKPVLIIMEAVGGNIGKVIIRSLEKFKFRIAGSNTSEYAGLRRILKNKIKNVV